MKFTFEEPKRFDTFMAHLNNDGFWAQYAGSTLQFRVDEQGITPIVIDEADGGNGHVTFQMGSLLDVGFLGEARAGSWDLMKWPGELQNHGLQFSDAVNQSQWTFEFADSDNSGTPDTLRATAVAP